MACMRPVALHVEGFTKMDFKLGGADEMRRYGWNNAGRQGKDLPGEWTVAPDPCGSDTRCVGVCSLTHSPWKIQ